MDHPTLERRSTTGDRRGPDGRGLALGVWLSLPWWLGLGLVVDLIRP